jgi:hypothetical protein
MTSSLCLYTRNIIQSSFFFYIKEVKRLISVLSCLIYTYNLRIYWFSEPTPLIIALLTP